LFFVIGADAFAEIETWQDYPAILDRAHFAVVSRPGSPASGVVTRLPALAPRMTSPSDAAIRTTPSIFLIDAATANVSASAIRQRASNGQSIVGLVTPAVGQHIERHALYTRATVEEPGTIFHRASAAGGLHGQD
jgi:nicotinate-nucleotide adenylyltransferase